MTPKDKAIELIYKFTYASRYMEGVDGFYYNINTSKESSIIAVDEIIKSTFSKKWYDKNNIIPTDYLLTEYWLEVKQEIEKL